MNDDLRVLPLVSIGLPIVKKEFLKQAIKSCLSQTYENLEIIILNNAPSQVLGDEIEKIVLSFDDKKIKYFRNEIQIPIVNNWNKVLSLSTGKYFSILCDDDYWDNNYIESVIRLAMKYLQVSVFHTRTIIVDDSGKMKRISPACPEHEDVLDFIFNRIAKGREHFLSDFLVKTESLKQIGGFVNMHSGWGSDDLTWIYLAKENGIVSLQMPLYYYRESILSVTNKMFSDNKIKTTNVYFEKIKDFVTELSVESNEILSLKKKMVLDCWEKSRIDKIKGIHFEYLRKRKLPLIIYNFVAILYHLKYR